MKKVFYLLVVIGMLLAMLPASAVAAQPKIPYLSVGDWNIDYDLPPNVGLEFSAYNVNWRDPKATSLEFGFDYCEIDVCWETVEVTKAISAKLYPYPQNLDLTGKPYHFPYFDTTCHLTQFVRILDSAGNVIKEATNGPYHFCLYYFTP